MPKHTTRDEHIEDVRALIEGLGTPLLSVKRPRPYGRRDQIIERVAKRASLRFGRRVSPRMVRTCWEAFGTLQLRLEKDV